MKKDLRDVLLDLGLDTPEKLEKFLIKYEGVSVDGLRFVRAGTSSNGETLWKIVRDSQIN